MEDQLDDFHQRLRAGEFSTGEELAAAWNRSYAVGCWDHLSGLAEAARNGIIQTFYGSLATAHSEVLDIGCGPGVLVPHLRRVGYRRYLGLDISSAATDKAQQFADEKTSFSARNFETDDTADLGTFDVIVINEALYYFDAVEDALHRVRQLLKLNGLFIISMFNGRYGDESYSAVEPARAKLWAKVAEAFAMLDEILVRQSEGYEWRIRASR